MLPPGAYMTLEHEYILIVRKGAKREFKTAADKHRRRSSAYFWQERNAWFSDVWMDLKGARQLLVNDGVRRRSGAFPFEIPYRLVNMFSIKGDTILDPFMGTGTTMRAAVAAARNSVGYEFESGFKDILFAGWETAPKVFNAFVQTRIDAHIEFLTNRQKENKPLKYRNVHYHFPVMTRQETELLFNPITGIRRIEGDRIEAEYSERPDFVFSGECKAAACDHTRKKINFQLKLF